MPSVLAGPHRSAARRGRHVLSILAAGLVAMLVAGAGAQAASSGSLVAPLARQTPLDRYGGWLLFSRFDGSVYHLSELHDGSVRDLAVPTQPKPFDADAGPDSHGEPSAVYSQCAASCDLFVIGLSVGATPRPVRNANTSGSDELAPSVWHGRLVFGRRYGKDRVVPYTKLLNAPRERPSSRLAGLPAKRCGAIDPPHCRPMKDVELTGMELWGSRVAQIWTYQPDSFPGFRQNEVRLTDVDRTDTRQVAAMTTGLGGQTYLGPAITNGRVAFFKTCQGDPGGCSSATAGLIRYRISTGGYEIAGDSVNFSGWAYDGGSDFNVPSDIDCSGGDVVRPSTPCGIYERASRPFSTIAASHLH